MCGELGGRSEPLVNNCPTPRAVLQVIWRPQRRINQAPTGVSPFGTPSFAFVQRYATSVRLWGGVRGKGWGRRRWWWWGGAGRVVNVVVRQDWRPIRTIGQNLPDSLDGLACCSAGHRAGSTKHQLARLPLGQHASPTYRGTQRSSSCGVGEGGPRRINQAPTGVPSFGTPCSTYAQRGAAFVLLRGLGRGVGSGGRSAGRVVKVVVRRVGRPI